MCMCSNGFILGLAGWARAQPSWACPDHWCCMPCLQSLASQPLSSRCKHCARLGLASPCYRTLSHARMQQRLVGCSRRTSPVPSSPAGFPDLLDGVAVPSEEPPTPDLNDLDLPPVPQYLLDRFSQQHAQQPPAQEQPPAQQQPPAQATSQLSGRSSQQGRQLPIQAGSSAAAQKPPLRLPPPPTWTPSSSLPSRVALMEGFSAPGQAQPAAAAAGAQPPAGVPKAATWPAQPADSAQQAPADRTAGPSTGDALGHRAQQPTASVPSGDGAAAGGGKSSVLSGGSARAVPAGSQAVGAAAGACPGPAPPAAQEAQGRGSLQRIPTAASGSHDQPRPEDR
jgi:hypothetical protein